MAKTKFRNGMVVEEDDVNYDIAQVGKDLTTLEAVAIRHMSVEVVFGDDAVAVAVGTLPAGVQIVDYIVSVTELFNGSGTDVLVLGVTANPDSIFEALDVSSVGYHDKTDLTEGSDVALEAAARAIEVLYTDQNSDATTGAATVTLVYAEIA